MSLIELFAWLAEGIIYRLNQTPDANYIKFLNLLGITRDPPAPAHTYLTFTTGSGSVLVPAGTQAQTPAQQDQAPIVFETDEDVTVLPTTLKAALANRAPTWRNAASSSYDNSHRDADRPARGQVPGAGASGPAATEPADAGGPDRPGLRPAGGR